MIPATFPLMNQYNESTEESESDIGQKHILIEQMLLENPKLEGTTVHRGIKSYWPKENEFRHGKVNGYVLLRKQRKS